MLILKPLLLLFLFTFSAWGLGSWVIKHFATQSQNTLNGLFFPFTLGTGFIIIITFLLLLTGSVNLYTVSLLLLFGTVFTFTSITKNPPTFGIHHVWFLAIFISEFIPAFVHVLSPESGPDALSYHLPYADFLANHQSLTVNKFLRYPLNALNFNMLYVIAYTLDGEILARMMHSIAALAVAIGLFEWGIKTHQRVAGLLAAFIWLSSVIVVKLLSSAYIDMGLTLFIFGAAFPFLINSTKPNTKSCYLSAFMLGIAIGTKYLGLLFLPFFTLWIGLLSRDLKLSVKYMVAAVLVGSPWYVYNIWISGNPVHPFLQNLFGYWLWTPDDIINQKQDLLVVHGVERTWFNLFNLPWLLKDGTYAKHGGISDLMIWGIFITPLMLLLKKYRFIAAMSLIQLIFWFFTSQILRYLLPVLPFFAILSATTLTLPLSWVIKKREKWFKAKALHAFLMVFTVIVILWAVAHTHKKIDKKLNRNQIAATETQWQALLDQNLDYQLINQANKNHASGTFKFGLMYSNHYADHPIMGDWFGIANMASLVKNTKEPQYLIQKLESLGADHLVIDMSIPMFKKMDDMVSQSEVFQLIFENNKGKLYQIKK